MCILVYICGFKSTATSYGKEDDVIIPSSEDATIEAASEDVAVIPSLKETVASKQERARKVPKGRFEAYVLIHFVAQCMCACFEYGEHGALSVQHLLTPQVQRRLDFCHSYILLLCIY